MDRYYSHGKLLLSGEYAVLDGAVALALPTRPGQWLEISKHQGPELEWISLEADGSEWLREQYAAAEWEATLPEGPMPKDARRRLLYILQTLIALKPQVAGRLGGTRITTRLEFPRNWGLGTSSTLLANLAAWSGVNPYDLLDRSFGGSGYDLACAGHEGPLFYSRRPGTSPEIAPAPFKPDFAGHLRFIYLKEKQDSREGIALYRKKGEAGIGFLDAISSLSRELASARSLAAFCQALDRHEAMISDHLGLPTVKQRLFPDFPGSVKSLGAWGGDFVLAAGTDNDGSYFSQKGYDTQFPYPELIL